MIRGRLAALWSIPLLLLLAGCQRAPVYVQEAYVFGTRVEVTVAGGDETESRAAVADVLREFDRLHQLLHAWQPSPLSVMNAALAAGEVATVPDEIVRLLADAQRISRDSDGLFDPGIGRLIALWGFQADDPPTSRPAASALVTWQQAPGRIADLVIDGNRVSARSTAVAIDLGGYAKGYALDRAAQRLRQRGIRNALINIGGNVMALGDKHGKAWRIGIRDPRGAGHLAALDLHDGEAIGTSGDYQRYFEAEGRRFSHLLDPRTAEPSVGTQAVTVLMSPGPQAGTGSDALSKPLFIAGASGWLRMAQRLNVVNVLRVGEDGRIEATPAMAKRLDAGDRPVQVVTPP